MFPKSVNLKKGLPSWVMVVGSVVIVLHLLVVAVRTLGARSGPWPFGDGNSTAEPPMFASKIDDFTRRFYLLPLHMAHDYHFETNLPEVRGVWFEVTLRDTAGKVIATLKFPEDHANFWVRHRQGMLAQQLIYQVRIEPAQGEQIPAPGDHRMVPNGQVVTPSEWSALVARSYQRYLCRQYGAASARLICHIRNPVHPWYLFVGDRIPADAFDELQCNFGDYRHDQ